MDFSIVAQRFKVARPFGFFKNGFLVYDPAGGETDVKTAELKDSFLQDFHLHFAHDGDPDLSIVRFGCDMELGILIGQAADCLCHHQCVRPFRQQQLIIHVRIQQRLFRILLKPQPLAGFDMLGPFDSHDHAGFRFIDHAVAFA